MTTTRLAAILLMTLPLGCCSASPSNPVNQTPPIRSMDSFFRSLDAPRPPPTALAPDYTHEPGYAPAYPPYQP